MSRAMVIAMFSLILLSMLVVTTLATMDRSVLKAGSELWPDRWFQATLADAYCGFVTFFLWVAWRERSWGRRVGWFLAIMLLGNIAMSIYVLVRVLRMPDPFSMERLLIGDREPSQEVTKSEPRA